MELRHLRYFVAAAEELNFRRAAVRLHIAQPALSVQISRLEAEIKVTLFLREARGVKLTEAGEVFLERARSILAAVGRSVSLAQQASNGEVGHLAIGHNGPAELLILPKIVPAFKERWKEVHLTFENLRTPEQIAQLGRDELDLGFVWLPVPTEEFDILELIQVPFVAVLPASHPLATDPEVSLKDLSKDPLILFTRKGDWESFHQIERLYRDAGATMNLRFEFKQLLSALNFVSMGSGYSILPDYSQRVLMKGVVYKPLRPSTVVKTLAVIKKKGRSGLADAFYRFLSERMHSIELENASSTARTSTREQR